MILFNTRFLISLFLAISFAVSTTAQGQCSQAHIFASDGAAFDYFGSSVAISGNTAVVGAAVDDTNGGTNAGSAYVFVRNGTGIWAEQAHLFASDGAGLDEFGLSVAISGDTAVVGAWSHDTPGGTNAGSAYVFVRNGAGTWIQQAQLFASDGAAGDSFGYPIAISGDTVVVAAGSDDTPAGANAGSAYVFVRDGEDNWTEQARLFGADSTAGDGFGTWLGISGDTVVVGAQFDDTPAGTNAGSAYVFVRNGETWSQEAQLFASDGAAADHFGYDVAISADTIAVGAPDDDTAGGTSAGSAYIFVRIGGIWTEQTHLFASDGAPGDFFSCDVAVRGDWVVVGANLDDTPTGTDEGSVYIFERIGGDWAQKAHLFATQGMAHDQFGYVVDISDDAAIVGTWLDDTLAGTDAGSAYIFDFGCGLGDLNCDDVTDLADVPHFVAAMLATGFTGCDITRADMNQDGAIDGRDTRAFIAAILE